jgi:hypothetical protein
MTIFKFAKSLTTSPLITVFFMIALCVLSANAQATRTWVSGGTGDDANPCSRTAPCKTFAGAISKTAAGGEINAMDPGGFGAVTITKSLTINGAGTLSSVLSAGTFGITINAAATDVVVLRNLSITGVSRSPSTGATFGIRILAAGKVNIENCDIREFGTAGIGVDSGTVGVSVKDTSIVDTVNGIRVLAAATGTTMTLDNVELLASTTGLNVDGNAIVNARNSNFSQNSTAGIATLGTSQVNLEGILIALNTTGISAGGSSAVRMSNVHVLNNGTGLAAAASGVIASFSNNKIAGNTTQGTPTAYLTSQ